MMRKLVIIFIMFIQLVANESLFQRGNDAYKAENYSQALEFYSQIEASDLESVALYYNLGNTYFKLGQLGQAIRYYEKAKKLSPLDDDVNANIKIIQAKLVDKIELPEQMFIFDLFLSLKYSLSVDGWFMLLLLCTSLCVISVLIKRFNNKRVGNILLTTGLCLTLCAGLFSYSRVNDLSFQKAVVIEKTATVYTAPNANSEAFILHEGALFDVIRTEGAYVEISLIDGKTGWIKQTLIGHI